MNLMPLVGFYWKHGAQINALLAKGGQSTLALDLAIALAPVAKKHYPELNANNLIDDALQTMKDALAPTPVA